METYGSRSHLVKIIPFKVIKENILRPESHEQLIGETTLNRLKCLNLAAEALHLVREQAQRYRTESAYNYQHHW